jgi:hypothetical protein
MAKEDLYHTAANDILKIVSYAWLEILSKFEAP